MAADAMEGRVLTLARLREVLCYDAGTGVFTWLAEDMGPKRTGRPAGFITREGRHRIKIDGTSYYAHRLAWFYTYGTWPSKDIDHANGNPADNRITNLREATESDNLGNAKRYANNTSGHKGVNWHPRHQKWRATISRNKRRHSLGSFDTKEEAIAAYRAAATNLFGPFSRF